MVSVLIPNYNHVRYLSQRIESVLNQTYQDIELIILDDCSTDTSREVIEFYRNHPKVSKILYNETNGGNTFKQWNKGIKEAKGDFIWIAESDDYADPRLLERLVPALQDDSNLVLGYCQSYNIDSEGKIQGTWKHQTDDLDTKRFMTDFVMSGQRYAQKFLVYKNTIPNASAVVFRKDKYWEIGGADETIKVSSDWRLWIKLVQTGNILFLSEELNYYRSHDNTVRSAAIQKGADILEHLQMIEFIFRNVEITNDTREKLIQNAANLIKQWLQKPESPSEDYKAEVEKYLIRIDKNLINLLRRDKRMSTNKTKMIFNLLKTQGTIGFVKLIIRNILKTEPLPKSPLQNYKAFFRLLKGKTGLEIGGPSPIFEKGNILPIYPIVKNLDGCNFSTNTIWEGEIKEGDNYKYDRGKKTGHQFICDASSLDTIPSNKYDFVLSSHSIEHIANPLKALKDWLRVLKDDGILLMVVPHKEGTFDHKRPVTQFNHLLADFRDNTQEDDLTHLSEILELHDLSLDPQAGTKENFHQRSLKNYENRCLHHHTFNAPLVIEILSYFNIQIKAINIVSPMHIIVIGRKTSKADNTSFLKYVRSTSPFTSDRE